MIAMIFYFLHWAVTIYTYVFMVYLLLSFFPIDENNVFARFLKGICEPLYNAVLKVLPRLRIGMIDLSPLYVFILLEIVDFIFTRLTQIFTKMGI